MTDKSIFKDIKAPQEKGPKHYKGYQIQPYEFISKNNLTFFQGVVIKYVVRYLMKDKEKDLDKIKKRLKLTAPKDNNLINWD